MNILSSLSELSPARSLFFPNPFTIMENANICFLLFAFSLAILLKGTLANGADRTSTSDKYDYSANLKLFIFGDSYADTGNLGKMPSLTAGWYEPYGMTFPKRPSGRFSDGRVFTDFVSSLMKIRSPIPFKYRKIGQNVFHYGMNFAVGGSGVFDTGNFQSNLNQQIGHLQSQIDAGVFSENDIKSSVAIVVISGNDYTYFEETDGPNYQQHIPEFINRLLIEFKADLLQLKKLGFKKVIVNNLHPIGYTPRLTRATNYTSAPSYAVAAVKLHNQKMDQMINDLNKPYQTFFILDLFEAFTNVIEQVNGAKEIKFPLVPCCEGISNTTYCGDLDPDKGIKVYKVCNDPEQHFYWDYAHPTQAGWTAAFEFLKPRLSKILS